MRHVAREQSHDRAVSVSIDGYTVLLDEDLAGLATRYRWAPAPARTEVYFQRAVNRRLIFLHKVIAGAPDDLCVDHKNGDSLDNRLDNLRVCTRSQNGGNSRKRGVPTTSRFKGVTWDPSRSLWRVQIRRLQVGRFASEIEAACVYDEEARALYGEFACLNFPREGERGCL